MPREPYRPRLCAHHAWVCALITLILLALLPPPVALAESAPTATEATAPGATGAATLGGVNYLFARRDDGNVWVRKTDGLWYSGWSPLSGQTDAAPAAAGTGEFVAVFIRGTDGALWGNRTVDGRTYAGWQFIGGRIAAAPTAIGAGGQIHLFTPDEEGMVWARTSTDGRSFSAPRNLGGSLVAAPVAIEEEGRVVLHGQGRDGFRYTLAARDRQATDWGNWRSRGGLPQPLPDEATSTPPTLDLGINFISADNWRNYQLPAYARLRPGLAKFSIFYDAYPTTPAFGTREIDDAIAAGARTVIFRTAETRIAPAEIERQLNAPLPGDGRSLLDYIQAHAVARTGIDFWIEVGNEPDLAGVSPLVARYGLLATIRDLGPKYRATHPNLRWMASLPTRNGLRDSPLPDYRGLAYLDLLLADRGDGLGSVGTRYDALGVHLYGADTLEQSYPALHAASDLVDCGGSNGDALCPDAVLDRALSQTDLPIFITEAGIDSAMPWELKAKYYVDAIRRMPARVRGVALFTLSLDPEWYAGGGDRCPKPAGSNCSHYALDVDERGVLDTSFAGASVIGQCYGRTATEAICAPPCRNETSAATQHRPRSAVRRGTCAVEATRPPVRDAGDIPAQNRIALAPAQSARGRQSRREWKRSTERH